MDLVKVVTLTNIREGTKNSANDRLNRLRKSLKENLAKNDSDGVLEEDIVMNEVGTVEYHKSQEHVNESEPMDWEPISIHLALQEVFFSIKFLFSFFQLHTIFNSL